MTIYLPVLNFVFKSRNYIIAQIPKYSTYQVVKQQKHYAR